MAAAFIKSRQGMHRITGKQYSKPGVHEKISETLSALGNKKMGKTQRTERNPFRHRLKCDFFRIVLLDILKDFRYSRISGFCIRMDTRKLRTRRLEQLGCLLDL